MWQISWEQVKYKSIEVLTSRCLWFPFGPTPCNQSLLFSPPSPSFLFVVLPLGNLVEFLELLTPKRVIRLTNVGDVHSDVSPCILLACVEPTSSLTPWALTAHGSIRGWGGEETGRVPTLLFHLQSYQLDPSKRLTWTCASPANSYYGTHVRTGRGRAHLFRIPQRPADETVCGIYKTFNLSLTRCRVNSARASTAS